MSQDFIVAYRENETTIFIVVDSQDLAEFEKTHRVQFAIPRYQFIEGIISLI